MKENIKPLIEYEKPRKGRPKKDVSVTQYLRTYVIKNPEVMHRVVLAWIQAITVDHNMSALQELLNRLEGKVIERHELNEKRDILIRFVPALPEGRPDVVEGEARLIE